MSAETRGDRDTRLLKVSLAIFVILIAAQAITGVITYFQAERVYSDGRLRSAQNLARGFSIAVTDLIIVDDLAAIESRVLQSMSMSSVISVLVSNRDGKVLAHSRRRLAESQPTLVFDNHGVDLPKGTPDAVFQSQSDDVVTTWVRVKVEDLPLGWVRVETASDPADIALKELRQRTLLVSLAATLVGSTFLGMLFWGGYRQFRMRTSVIERELDSVSLRLGESEKLAALGTLSAGVAHEINNPIAYVSSNLSALEKYVAMLQKMIEHNAAFAEQLKRDSTYEHVKSEISQIIRESREGITRVRTIVRDLKNFARADTAAQWIEADLRAEIKSALNIANHEIKQHGATVQLDLPTIPTVDCIPSQLNQVFLNLIINAAQSIVPDRGGTITLRTGHSGDHVWVEIADTGCGISAEHLSKIFDPFFTTKEVGIGTGMGLSVSLGIINRHRGTMSVRSEVGVGTCFRIELPVSQTSRHEPSEQAITT